MLQSPMPRCCSPGRLKNRVLKEIMQKHVLEKIVFRKEKTARFEKFVLKKILFFNAKLDA